MQSQERRMPTIGTSIHPWTAKERTIHGLEQQGEREREKHQRNQERWVQLPLMLSRSPTAYLGMGDPRSVSISALIQNPPLRCCRRGVHPSSMAATVSMAVAVVRRAPPPLCLAHRLARAVAFVLLRALVSCVGLGNGSIEAGD